MTEDAYLQVREKCFALPGIRGEVTLLQVSDLHLCAYDAQSTPEEKERAIGQAKAWNGMRLEFARLAHDSLKETHLLPPEEGLWHFVDFANALRPDALLLTGDILNEVSGANLRLLRSALSEVRVPWMFVPGNHEAGMAGQTEGILPNGGGIQTLSLGGCTLIGLDTSGKRVSARQLDDAVRAAQRGIGVVVTHIPARTAFNAAETACFDSYYLLSEETADEPTRAYLDMLTRESCPFRLILCGHVHGAHLSRVGEKVWQLCASSAMVGACHVVCLRGEG